MSLGLLVRNNTKCRYGDIATQALDSVIVGAQIFLMIRWQLHWTSCKGPSGINTYFWSLICNALSQRPIKSPLFTSRVSQELIFFCPTEFRNSPEEWASIFVKLALQVLFLKKGASQLLTNDRVSTLWDIYVICSPVFNVILKWFRVYAKWV